MTVVGAKSMAGTPSAVRKYSVRSATENDRDFVVALASQWVASAPAHWRNPRRMLAAYITVMDELLKAARPDAALLVAEDCRAIPLACLLLVKASLFQSWEGREYIAQLALAPGACHSCVYASLIAVASKCMLPDLANSASTPLRMATCASH